MWIIIVVIQFTLPSDYYLTVNIEMVNTVNFKLADVIANVIGI